MYGLLNKINFVTEQYEKVFYDGVICNDDTYTYKNNELTRVICTCSLEVFSPHLNIFVSFYVSIMSGSRARLLTITFHSM